MGGSPGRGDRDVALLRDGREDCPTRRWPTGCAPRRSGTACPHCPRSGARNSRACCRKSGSNLRTRHLDSDVPQAEARRRLFEAMVRAIAGAPQPLLLFIDDIQWADRDTLEWIGYFLRSEEPLWVLVVATLRLGEVPLEDRLDAVLLDLRRDGRLEEIPLEPLDVADTAALGAAVAGATLDPAAARALHRETEGHPLYIVEMMRSKCRRGWMTPSLLWRRQPGEPSTGSGAPQSAAPTGPRNHRGPPRAALPRVRMVVGVAAVIGREFRMDLLSEGSGISEDEARLRAG